MRLPQNNSPITATPTDDGPRLFGKILSVRVIQEGYRFILGGLSSMCVCWGFCLVLVKWVGLHYLIGTNLAVFITWGYSYGINKYFVFKNVEKKHAEHGAKFFVLQAVLLGLSNLQLYLMVGRVGLRYFPALIINTVIITILNFICMKFFVFGPRLKKEMP